MKCNKLQTERISLLFPLQTLFAEKVHRCTNKIENWESNFSRNAQEMNCIIIELFASKPAMERPNK